MARLNKLKRFSGWAAVIGLILTFLTMHPLSQALVDLPNDWLLLLTTGWIALAWSSLAALIAWLACYLINTWVRRARTGKLDQGWLP